MDSISDLIQEYQSDILSPSTVGFNEYLKSMTTKEERDAKTFEELWGEYLDSLEIARQAQMERMRGII